MSTAAEKEKLICCELSQATALEHIAYVPRVNGCSHKNMRRAVK
jgi:hypothetical protein